jgi:hypothetical protein
MKEKILAFVEANGPLLPKTVAKEFKLDTTFAGAYLSELISNKKIFVSNTKIGGSPVYYVPEQKEKLQDLYQHLNEKDKKTYDLLKQKKILRDADQTPLVRASLRTLKDFAVSLQVNVKPEPQLFWKWYLITKEEAEQMIKELLKVKEPVKKAEEKKPEPKKKEEKKPTLQPELKKIEIKSLPSPEETKKEKKEEPKEVQEKIIEEKPKPKPEKKPAVKKPKKKPEPSADFLNEINKYFANNKINVIHSEIIKKTEIDFMVEVPSVVGKLEYYCKAKKKKKCNEGDLSSAFVVGQTKKLPVLFLTTGELTKRAQGMLDKEFKNHLVFKKI